MANLINSLILVLIALTTSFTNAQSKYNYSEVIAKSLLFYEAQRSGVLPPNKRIPWRGDSFTSDVGQNGEDLSGGYFDGIAL